MLSAGVSGSVMGLLRGNTPAQNLAVCPHGVRSVHLPLNCVSFLDCIGRASKGARQFAWSIGSHGTIYLSRWKNLVIYDKMINNVMTPFI